MSPRRIAVVGTALVAAVAVLASIAEQIDVALAALGVAVLGVLGYLVLSMRDLQNAVDRAARDAARARADVRVVKQRARAARGRPERDTGPVVHELRVTRRRIQDLIRGQADIRNTIHRAPGLTAEMIRVYDRLVTHTHPMPELGGWAASPSTMLWIIDHVSSTPVRTVVECGSGSSTVWIAAALERRGGEGHVVAFESSDHYASLTRAELDRLGLGGRATVVHAPLVETPLPGRPAQPWFDVTGVELPGPIDLLFVDGPPGGVAREARYPAFPVLADRLAAGAVVVLDDTGRREEDGIVRKWCQETHHGRSLTVSRTVDRSTVLVAGQA